MSEFNFHEQITNIHCKLKSTFITIFAWFSIDWFYTLDLMNTMFHRRLGCKLLRKLYLFKASRTFLALLHSAIIISMLKNPCMHYVGLNFTVYR